MRVLIHGANYTPEVTGIGKYMGEMGAWLAARGHDVRVVTAPPYYPSWRIGEGYSAREYRRERVSGADVWRCPLWVPARPTGAKRLVHLASFALSSFPVMLRQIPWRPEAVVVIEPPLFCAPAAWLVARLCAAGTLLNVLDFEVDAAMDLGVLRKSRLGPVIYGVERLLMSGATQVSTLTEPMRRRIIQKGVPRERTWLFPNWSDLDFVRPMERENEVRRQFGAGPDDVLVLHAGNMGEKQGLELVLDAAEKLRGRKEIKFALVGAGAKRDSLEKDAARRKLENVRFFPLQPLERLPLMMAAADVHMIVQRREAADLVMPSRMTNILAAGRPAVATADPGTALYEVFDEHDCGINTPPGNVEDFVAAVVFLAENAGERERLGENARRYAESHLGKQEILLRLEGKLMELARG